MTTKPVGFRFNAHDLEERGWSALRSSDRGAYMDAAWALWTSRDGYKMPLDAVPVKEDVLRRLIRKGFFEKCMDSDWGCTVLVSMDLRHQVKAASERERQSASRRVVRAADAWLPAGDKGPEIRTMPTGDRTLPDSFEGWMPTELFGARGQHVIFSPAQLDAWRKRYKDVDVGGQMDRMYMMLKADPRKRPTAGRMHQFVESWLKRRMSDAASQYSLDKVRESFMGSQ